MNRTPDFDHLARAWLQDGPDQMPDRSLQAALDEVHLTAQQRFGAARRILSMNSNTTRIAAAVAAVIFIGVAAIYLGRSSPAGVG